MVVWIFLRRCRRSCHRVSSGMEIALGGCGRGGMVDGWRVAEVGGAMAVGWAVERWAGEVERSAERNVEERAGVGAAVGVAVRDGASVGRAVVGGGL